MNDRLGVLCAALAGTSHGAGAEIEPLSDAWISDYLEVAAMQAELQEQDT